MSATSADNRGRAAASVPPVAACPACIAATTASIGTVTVRDQHLAYAHGDIAMAERLDGAFERPLASYAMQRCQGCGLEFADPALAPPPGWYAELYAAQPLYPAGRWEFDAVRSAIASQDTVVDYGCGSGEFLASLAGRARMALGFDFSQAAVAAAARRGLQVRALDLDGRDLAAGTAIAADHITAFHVLEHLARPAALFDFARGIAAPGARLWVAVPSDRRASRVHGEPDLLDAPPHHLTRWTEAALGRLGQRSGWSMERHVHEPLPLSLAVWEATRRLPLYQRMQPRWRPLEWASRRALAAAVWATGAHRRPQASGFSMLSCFRLLDPA